MSRLIQGTLLVPTYTSTGTPGEYTFEGAAYNNSTDLQGLGASALQVGFLLGVPASDPNSFELIPGVAHRYKITSLTVVDAFTINATIMWDEAGSVEDIPANGALAVITQPTEHYKMSSPISSSLYAGLGAGVTESLQAIEFAETLDSIGTDWNVISNHPTDFSGYGLNPTTTDVPEGSNLYWTSARAAALLADAALASSTALDAEVTARIAADTTLQSNLSSAIASEQTSRDAAITAAVAAEATSRLNADAGLVSALAAEQTAREAADIALQASLTSEATLRDAAIASAVASEASARTSAITAEVSARDLAISSALSSEISLRDAAIASAVAAEQTARETAILAEATSRDAAIASAVSAEATLREAADAAEVSARNAAISAAVASESTLRSAAITAEVSARDAAISSAISSEASLRDTAISAAVSTEATLRDAAIAAAVATEQTARINAVVAEASSRDAAIAAAIAVETSARQAADKALLGGLRYLGSWDASTNSPVIPAASEDNKGGYYVVSVAGSTDVNGINDWQPTDWIVSDGLAGWVKIDNSDKVSTVNGQTGVVTLTTDTIAEGASQYFTEARVLASLLNGLNPASGTVTSSDSLLTAFNKLVAAANASTTASASSVTYFNATSRYQMVTTSGLNVWCHSSSKGYGNLSWSRTGTSLVLQHKSHGHSAGDRVILRNANVDYLAVTIDSITADSFTVTCADSGATSGASAYYSMGFNFAHNAAAGSITGGTLSAPANENVQLISLRVRLGANTRSTTTYNVVLPTSSINGAGGDTGFDDIYIPVQQVRQETTGLTAVGNTIGTSISGSFSTIQFGALPAVATGLHLLMQF